MNYSKPKKIYNLFISHSWTYENDYYNIVNLLDNAKNDDSYDFDYKNYSIPKDDPVHTSGSDKALRIAIEGQIVHASCVLILDGVYSTYSDWINAEIDIAKSMGKKIIAVDPWGAQKTSRIAKDAADETVKWNTSSIVSAIKRQVN